MLPQQKIQRTKSETRVKKLQKIGFAKEVIKLRKDYSNSNKFQELRHQQRSKSLKTVNKNINRKGGGFLDSTKIISVSAHKWVIYDYFSNKYIRGYRAHDPYELSVFSKLLVFCTINTLIVKYKIDVSRFQTIVTPSVTKFHKNTQLKVDDVVTLQHLIHLLLMDEGQQYELIAALNIGAYLQKKRKKQYYSVYDADEKMFKIHLAQFYDLVNSYCQTLKMQNIKYVESDPAKKKQNNRSSASDIAILSSECLKIPYFRQILKLKNKIIEIKSINNEGALETRKIQLLNKTVSNPFISYFNVCRNWNQNQFMNSNGAVFYEELGIQPIIVVLFGSYGPLDREKDIQQIIEWYIKSKKILEQSISPKENITNKNKQQNPKQRTKTIINQMHIIEENEGQDQQKDNFASKIDSKTQVRLKTENTRELDKLLEDKLRGFDSKGFRINSGKKSKRSLTQI